MGRRRDAGGAEGGGARNPEERLGLRAPYLVRAVALAGRLPVEPQGRPQDSGDHPVLEYREDLSRSFKRKRPARAGRLFGRAAELLHQARAAERRLLVLAQDAEAAGDLGVGLDQAAEVAAEAVLVELVLALDVPQPARIGRDLVGDDDAHQVAFPQAAGLHLEVDEPDADA